MESVPVRPADIRAAAVRIEGHVRRTPVLDLPDVVDVSGRLCLKLDLLQPTGSFKPRGAFNLLLGDPPRPNAGVVAASGGNFGLAVFVPDSSPIEKIEALAAHGARVEVVPGFYPQALAASRAAAAQTGAAFAHAYDQALVVAGQGTCAKEIAEQVRRVDTVLVAVGGGGLIGGVAAWFGDQATIIGVETTLTPTLHAAMAAGGPVDVDVGGIAASALGAGRVGDIAWALASRWVDDVLLVTDDEVMAAQRFLWRETRLVAEPAAAAPLAALLAGHYRPRPEERVVVIVCGANTDPASVVG
jgi:threonine dehydratase